MPLGSRRLHAGLLAVTLAYALGPALGWRDMAVPLAHWVAHALVCGALGAVAVLAVRRLPRVGDTLAAAAWALWYNGASAPLAYALMRGEAPLRDGLLAGLDRAIGLPVPRVRAWLDVVPEASWWQCYGLLVPLLFAAVLLLPLLGWRERARRLIVAYVISFALALPVMLAVQAVGPWAAHGFPPSPEQLGYVREFTALRTPGPFALDSTRITGVVTFPSFHALLATLAGVALAPVRGIGPLGAVLAAGVVLATVATGWHYVVDALAGVLLAALAWRAAAPAGRLAPAS